MYRYLLFVCVLGVNDRLNLDGQTGQVDKACATFGESDYDQKDSAGFINLYGLPIKVQAMVDAKNKK